MQVNVSFLETNSTFVFRCDEIEESFEFRLDGEYRGGVNPYQGEYEATPSMETQVFSTNGLRMTDDFVVHPIPSNYGLITYNGLNITVS